MPSIKPILKLTAAQYKRLLERVISREPGQASRIAPEALRGATTTTPSGSMMNFPGEMGKPRPDLLTGGMGQIPLLRRNPTTMSMPGAPIQMRGSSAVDEVMATQPPRELIMSRLRQQKEGVPFTEPTLIERDYPFIEAKMRYLKNPATEANPGGYIPVNAVTRGYKRLRGVVPGSAEDVTGKAKKGLSYEKVRFKSVESQFEQKARRAAQEPEAMGKASLPEIISTATLLERMWQLMGGKRSVSGHFWESLRKGSPGKTQVKDTKDYFIRSGLRWREDPVKFARQWPREAKLLTGIWDELSKGVE